MNDDRTFPPHKPAAIPPAMPWRLLVLDRSDPADPRWLLATITLGSDILAAELDTNGRYTGWVEVTQWVRDRLGHDIQLSPIPAALAWLVDGRRPR
jgi:hypothetical protein